MEDNFDIRKEDLETNDQEFEKQLRPVNFDDFKGQKQIIDNLTVFVTAARQRENRSIMYCCMDLRGLERQRLRQ